MKRRQKRLGFIIQFWFPFILILVSFGLSTTEDTGDSFSAASLVTEIIPSKTLLPSNEADPPLTDDLQKNVDFSSILLFPSSSSLSSSSTVAVVDESSSMTTLIQETILSSAPELIEASYVEPITEQHRTNQTSELTPLETISAVFIEMSHDSITSETQEVSILEKLVTKQMMQSDLHTVVTSPIPQNSLDIPVVITQSQSEDVPITKSQLEKVPVTQSKSEDGSITQSQSEEVSITQSQSEDVSLTQSKPEDVSLTQSKPEEVSVTQTQSEEVSITQSQSEEVSITQSALPEEPSGIHGKVLLDEKLFSLEEITEPLKAVEEPVNTEADKPEDFPSFNEWLAEQEKTKHDVKAGDDKKHLKQGRRGNYASRECGAKILASNPEAVNIKSMLNSNKDEYMINPCKVKKWFDLELCEPIQFQSVEIASLEMFSSQPKTFKLYISDRYPAKDWRFVGDFHMSEVRGPQNFPVTGINEFYAKFVRVELLEHYGDEHFCPVTFFRVYGIAVYEDDDDDVETQRSTVEEDEESFVNGELALQDEDGGVDMKKILESAKDTVINIVKKVLKVEDQIKEAYRNGTEEFVVDNRNEMDNTSSLNDTSHMLPCVPEVRISENVSMENESMKQREPQPQPPHAFVPEGSFEQVNKVPIVTKLEDNEQIPSESLNIPAISDIAMVGLDLSHTVSHCFSCDKEDVLDLGREATLTKFCAYVSFFLDKHLDKTGNQDDSTQLGFIVIESSLQSETSATVQPSSVSESKSVITPVEEEPQTQSDSTLTTFTPTMSEESSAVAVTDSCTAEVVKSSASKSVEDTIKTVAQTLETLTFHILSSIPTSSVSFLTKISESTLRTSTIIMVSASSSEITSSQASEIVSTSSSELVSDTPLVEPSTTGLPVNIECGVDSAVFKTPSLIDVKDTLKPDTDIVDSCRQESFASKQTEQVKDDKLLSVVTSPVLQPTEPIIPSISISLEPSHIDLPTLPSGESPVHSSSDFEKLKLNVTEIPTDHKPERKAGVDLELVKVPIMPASKRESAIMRLSNRIKVLEQNVTLSSLFLDALSKRFKKQSEEMMKMLNKTVAKLNNATLITAAKDQMQEERIYILEEEIRNLTKIVNYLTKDLDTLNQQVKDRQMVWSTIEIIIIVVILIIANRRGKKSNFSPEIQQLIDSMPSKPLPPTPHRRNSYSGPITPSKQRDKLTGTLQKYRSETALAASDFPIVEPLFSSSTQIKEGQKRKKKKKQRSMDFKLSSFWTENRPLIEGQEWQNNCPEYYRRDSEQSSTKSSQCGEPNVLTGYYNRNMEQTSLSLGGHKMLPKPLSNPKVQLRECKTSPNLQSGFNISSCDCRQESKSASQSRRNSQHLQSLKMKDIPGPPVTSKVPTQITITPSDLGQRRHVRIQNQSNSKDKNSQGHGSEVKHLCDLHCQDYYDSHVNGIQNVKLKEFVKDGEVGNHSQYYNNSKGKFSPFPMKFTAQNGYSETDFNGFHGNGHGIHDYILDDLCNVAHSSEKEIINASKEKSVSTGIWKKVFG